MWKMMVHSDENIYIFTSVHVGQSLVEELNLMCLSTRELVLRCCADLAEQQAKALGSPEHKYGELTLSVGYIKEKAALEATVFQARLVEGKKSCRG